MALSVVVKCLQSLFACFPTARFSGSLVHYRATVQLHGSPYYMVSKQLSQITFAN